MDIVSLSQGNFILFNALHQSDKQLKKDLLFQVRIFFFFFFFFFFLLLLLLLLLLMFVCLFVFLCFG